AYVLGEDFGAVADSDGDGHRLLVTDDADFDALADCSIGNGVDQILAFLNLNVVDGSDDVLRLDAGFISGAIRLNGAGEDAVIGTIDFQQIAVVGAVAEADTDGAAGNVPFFDDGVVYLNHAGSGHGETDALEAA